MFGTMMQMLRSFHWAFQARRACRESGSSLSRNVPLLLFLLSGFLIQICPRARRKRGHLIVILPSSLPPSFSAMKQEEGGGWVASWRGTFLLQLYLLHKFTASRIPCELKACITPQTSLHTRCPRQFHLD